MTKGWDVVQEFIDAAESARTVNGPEFQRMIALAKKKPPEFEVILVWKLPRFAQNREDFHPVQVAVAQTRRAGRITQ